MENTTNTETTNTPTVHPFTARGLGQAPFRYIGAVEQDLCYGQAILNRAEYERTGIALTTAPGGSCAYCGNYILHMFNVKSADGNVFHVGSDCIEKVYGPTHKIVRAVAKVVADRTKARKAARTLVEGEIIAHRNTLAAYTARGLDASRIAKVAAQLSKAEAQLARIVAELAKVE